MLFAVNVENEGIGNGSNHSVVSAENETEMHKRDVDIGAGSEVRISMDAGT